ncbi:hypothetical protein [Tenacibaculum agarivorans]|uniref:hypothetical protein n=1 Tax=Tenacibaculum agarivorans TaxID=1908389 RepID=UPI00094B7DDC|nr:hypothetical protein [Tenacibaculum agarivorans]
MNKFLALLLILIIAPILGGLYGILNDQITYTISSEYYTKFKFIQFGFENWGLGKNIGTENIPEIKLRNPRVGASIIGFLATWWVGMIIGILLGFVGLIHKNGKQLFLITIKSFVLTIVIALLTGIIGLLYGKLFLLKSRPNWYFPENLIDFDRFILVGSVHNFSYLGGLIGLIGGITYSIRQKKKYVE